MSRSGPRSTTGSPSGAWSAGHGPRRSSRLRIDPSCSSAATGPHEEDTWIGSHIAIGSAVIEVTKPDARCAITTQSPDTGERDLDTLRTILRYRGFRADDPDHKIDFGVLGEVAVAGRISVGDEIVVRRAAAVA